MRMEDCEWHYTKNAVIVTYIDLIEAEWLVILGFKNSGNLHV